MSEPSPVTEDTFLRKLAFRHKRRLASMLDIHDLWKSVAEMIPVSPELLFGQNLDWEPRYNAAHIHHFKNKGQSPTMNLLDDWGMKNVKLKHLEKVLYLAQVKGAATYIREDVLHRASEPQQTEELNFPDISSLPSLSDSDEKSEKVEASPLPFAAAATVNGIPKQNHNPHQSPTKPVRLLEQNVNEVRLPDTERKVAVGVLADGSVSYVEQTDERNENMEAIGSRTEQMDISENVVPKTLAGSVDMSRDIVHIPYTTLRKITDNFNKRDAAEGGNFIGEGGFGYVYLGTFKNGPQVAVKCLKEESQNTQQQLEAEIKTLRKCRHKNLVRLMGYSCDSALLCLVYQYMMNGSLEDRLARKHNTEPLTPVLRMDIVHGTAHGISFLHENGLIHSDIKTANILLDSDYTPKVGDFATARMIPSGSRFSEMLKVSKVIGTSTYLAPEAYTSHVHQGLDCYSFGIVLLEVLTGLPVMDMNRKEHDLKSYVLEHCTEESDDENEGVDECGENREDSDTRQTGTIFDLIDNSGGMWDGAEVELLFGIFNKCVEISVKRRAKMAAVLKWLETGKIGR